MIAIVSEDILEMKYGILSADSKVRVPNAGQYSRVGSILALRIDKLLQVLLNYCKE